MKLIHQVFTFFENAEIDGINAAKYVVENYPESKFAELIQLTHADTMDIDEYNDYVILDIEELEDDYFE